MRGRGSHPKTTDRVRTALAKASFPRLVGEFLLVVAALSLALAVAFELTDESGTPFLEWWKQLALALLSFPTDQTLAPNVAAGRGVLELVAAGAGIVLPALFVGAVVVKLFTSPDLFVMRGRIAVTKTDDDDLRELDAYHLAIRGYSSTDFDLLNVTFSVIARTERVEGNGTKTLVHRKLTAANALFPVAQTHVPYTVALSIRDEDWANRDPGGELVRLQGNPIESIIDLIVLIEGSIPKLSTDFVEAHYFSTEAITRTPYTGISVDYRRPSGTWGGWEKFDE